MLETRFMKHKSYFMFGGIINLLAIIISIIRKEYIYIYSIVYIDIISGFLYYERKNLINIKSVFLFMYTIMVGISPICYYIEKHTLISNRGNNISYQFVPFLAGLCMLIIGFYRKDIKKIITKNDENNKLKEKCIPNKTKNNIELIGGIFLCIVSILANAIFIFQNRASLFSGNLENNRIEAMATNGFILLLTGFNFIGIGLLYNVSFVKTKVKKYVLIIIAISVIFSIMRGSRSSIIKIFILMFFIRNLKKPFSIKQVVHAVLAIVVLIVILQIARSAMSNKSGNFIGALLNTFEVGSFNYNFVYVTFPEKEPFQWGYTYLINIIMMKPGNDPDFTLWLKEKTGTEFAGGGLTPTIIGESYLNFGFLGIIIIMYLTGILGNKLNELYFEHKENLALNCALIVILIDIFRGGYANVEIGLIQLLMVYLGMYLIECIDKRWGVLNFIKEEK